MITNKRKKIGLIHIAKIKTGITDEEYQALLEASARIKSCSQLENEVQFQAIMKSFQKLGFGTQSKPKSRWKDTWDCSPAQRAKIEVMWRSIAINKSDEALAAFIKRITGVSPVQYITKKDATAVIQALIHMERGQK